MLSAFFIYLFFESLISLTRSTKAPPTQYGITKVKRKIINQNPIVRMVKNAKKPKY